MKSILVMESGSMREGYAVAGAAKASYQLYAFFKSLKDTKVDFYADFSKLDASAKPIGKDELLKTDYDFVFMNSIRDVLIADSYAKNHKGAKVVYTDRGNVIANQENAGVKKLLPKMMARASLLKRMKTWLYAYVAITAEEELYARNYFPESVQVFYIPIAPDVMFKDAGAKKKFNGALFIGRLDERQKKVEFLIRGIKLVKERHEEVENKLILKIVGAGLDEQKYKTLVAGLGLQDNIAFEGELVGKPLVDEYNDAAFFVSTSQWESPGRTFLEAMACGIPLLINNSNNALVKTNPKEYLVRDGYNGLVYAYDDIDNFEIKFFQLYSDEELREKLAANAKQYIKKFSLENTLSSYRDLLG